MKKKRIISIAAALMMLFTSTAGTITANAALKKVAKPVPVIAGVKSSYASGETIKVQVTSPKAAKNVQYKATLINNKTKKTAPIPGDFMKKVYTPTAVCAFTFAISNPGSYTLTVRSTLVGYKSTYSTVVSKKITITQGSQTIDSVNLSQVVLNKGDSYSLPATVSVNMKDGTVKEYGVKWDKTSINTSVLGNVVVNGTLVGTSYKVSLNISIVDEKITSVDTIYADVDEGKEYKLPATINAKLGNGSLKTVSVVWGTASVDTSKTGTFTYEGTIDKYSDKVKLVLTVKPVQLSIENVVSDNLKEIMIKFNKKVDAASVKAENIRLYKNGLAVSSAVRVSDDGKSAIVASPTGTSYENQREYSLTIEKVKDLNGVELQSITKKFTVLDVTIPQVLSAKFTGSSKLCIEFSEPVKDSGARLVEVKSGNIPLYVNSSYTGFETNKIYVNLSSTLTENAQYDVTVKGFKDFAGYDNALRTFNVIYKKDITPITAQVEGATQTFAVVRFNKPVTGLMKDMFYHTNAVYSPVGIYSDAEMTQSVSSTAAVERVWIKFYDPVLKSGYIIPESVQYLTVVGKVYSYEIKDGWDNKFVTASIPMSLNIDKTPARVVSLGADTESRLSIVFDEDVSFNSTNVEVLDMNGNRITGTAISVSGSGKQYYINLGKNLEGTTVKVNIKNVDDKALVPNRLSSYSQSVTITDKTAPRVDRVVKKYVSGVEQSIYVYFNEPVGSTALDASNYYIQNPVNNMMIRLTEKPVFYYGSTVVKLSLTNEQKTMVDAGYNLFVSNVSDISGNALIGQIAFSSSFTSYDSSDNKPKVTKLQIADSRTLAVTFNQVISRMDKEAFMVNGAAPAALTFSYGKDGTTTALLTTASGREFSSDPNSYAALSIMTTSTVRVENIFGVNLDQTAFNRYTSIKIEDGMQPSIKVVADRQQVFTLSNVSGIIDAIAIEYNKDINMNKLSALSYYVEGRAVVRVYTNTAAAKGTPAVGRFVIIELKTDGIDANTTDKPLVTQLLDVYDMNDNKISPDGAAIYPLDKSAPMVVTRLSSQIAAGESKMIKFSEALNSSSKTVVQSAVTTASRGTGVLTYSWISDSTVVITNISSTTPTSFQAGVPVKASLTDLDGNTNVDAVIISL